MQLDAFGPLTSQDPNVGSNGNVIRIACESKFGAASFQITGTWSGQIEFEVSNDGANYLPLSASKSDATGSATHATGNGHWFANIASAKYVQARMSSYASGSAVVTLAVSVTPASGTGSSGGGGGGGGAATIADGADVAEGTTTDVAVTGDNAGTVKAALRGLGKLFADVWDSVNHRLKVDGSGVTQPVSGTVSVQPVVASTETLTNVASSASNVTLLSSSSSRKGVILYNDSTQTLFLKFGTTASATSFTYNVFPSQTLEFPAPMYTGQVDGIWASANGNARITEAT